ncbi:MAG: hypothetical protein AB8G22_07845 [Saprospiraceae bacterium]
MDCNITAAKVIHFIHPILLSVKCTAANNRQVIWDLLKTTFDDSDQKLITQFERYPSLHYLRIAATDLLTLHLKKDEQLQLSLTQFLNTYYDLEILDQQPESKTDLFSRARSISIAQVVRPFKRVRQLLPI